MKISVAVNPCSNIKINDDANHDGILHGFLRTSVSIGLSRASTFIIIKGSYFP